jgi:hypothetical protein
MWFFGVFSIKISRIHRIFTVIVMARILVLKIRLLIDLKFWHTKTLEIFMAAVPPIFPHCGTVKSEKRFLIRNH